MRRAAHLQPRLDCGECRVVNDAQVGRLARGPIRPAVRAADAGFALGALEEVLAVVNDPSGIKRIAQDAVGPRSYDPVESVVPARETTIKGDQGKNSVRVILEERRVEKVVR